MALTLLDLLAGSPKPHWDPLIPTWLGPPDGSAGLDWQLNHGFRPHPAPHPTKRVLRDTSPYRPHLPRGAQWT